VDLDRLIGHNVFFWMLLVSLPITGLLMLFGRRFAQAERETEVIVGVLVFALIAVAVWATFHYA
jgi:hypothetical protein